ncbi:MAG: hypothetical protein M0Z81_06700 [Deltaproteobacteria bacterium]|jgi:hypothetical protein|nr:hypothetical protein [Deltaproteobacteria bacterium]
MSVPEKEDVVLAQVLVGDITVQLVERSKYGCFLRRLGPGGVFVEDGPPISSDMESLAEARDLFPEHLPWAGMAVDAGL